MSITRDCGQVRVNLDRSAKLARTRLSCRRPRLVLRADRGPWPRTFSRYRRTPRRSNGSRGRRTPRRSAPASRAEGPLCAKPCAPESPVAPKPVPRIPVRRKPCARGASAHLARRPGRQRPEPRDGPGRARRSGAPRLRDQRRARPLLGSGRGRSRSSPSTRDDAVGHVAGEPAAHLSLEAALQLRGAPIIVAADPLSKRRQPYPSPALITGVHPPRSRGCS